MEKIYVEENQKKNKNTRLGISVGLSFAVAFAAIVSILFVSMSGTTYSLDDVTTLPATITTVAPTHEIADEDGLFRVHPYSAQGISNPIYCVESNVDYEANITLSRVKKSGGGEYVIEDVGFIYLLTKIANLSVNASDINSSTTISDADKVKYVNAWLKQTAIWSYLGRIGAANSSPSYSADKAATLYALDSLNVTETGSLVANLTTTDSTKSFYELVGLKDIVDTAYANRNNTTYLSVGLTKASDKFTVTKGYLKSDKIIVKYDNTGDISSKSDTYSLTLSNAPKGTKVYGINSSGKEELIKDLKNVSYSKYKSLYLYVPTSEVKGTVKFSVGITGKFEVYTGYYYENGTAQRVTTVDKVAMSKNAGEDFTITKAPDTASNASRIMYIVGMVVLLSGLGILYVNIKNQKQYQ